MPVQYVTVYLEVTARIDCEFERNDYGVKGSPVWYEADPDTIEVSGIDIEGFGVDGIPKELLEHIEELAAEKALEKGEWK